MNEHFHPPYHIDLHIHTTFSDGKYTPEDVLCRAAEEGIQTLAFCDHDNTRGLRQGRSMAQELGMQLIPAMELTCSWNTCSVPLDTPDVNLLGYFIDVDEPGFQEFETAALDDLYARMNGCCAILVALGIPIHLEDLLAVNPRYAGLIQMQQALLNQCCVSSWDAAADLVRSAWQQVRPSRLSIELGIAQIHAAGGVAVLAHPAALTGHGPRLQAADIARLMKAGLDGIEVYHPSAGAQARDHFLSLAHHFGLLLSGGSDEHGWFTGLSELGTQPVTPAMLEALSARHHEICARVGMES